MWLKLATNGPYCRFFDRNRVDPGISAVDTLGRFHLEPGLVVPALIDLLRSSDAILRKHVVTALAKYGAYARPAISALTKLLNEQDPAQRVVVWEALKGIDSVAAAKAGVNTNSPGLEPARRITSERP